MDNSSEIDNISENKMSQQYSWPTANKYWEEMEIKNELTEMLELLSVGSASSQLKTLTHIVEKYKTSYKIPPIIYGEKSSNIGKDVPEALKVAENIKVPN